MKALSVKQPYASLICTPREDNTLLGIKDIENRTWQTHYRGKIYIHATAKAAKEPYQIFTDEQASVFIESDLDFNMLQSYKENSRIIGEVEIVDCVINHPSIWAEKTPFVQTGNKIFYPNKPVYNWVLANPVLYEMPILNVKGKLSFWEPDIDIVECIGCSQKFDSEFMEEDDGGEKFCSECWNEISPAMIQETKDCKYD